jgi:hypothetical protein
MKKDRGRELYACFKLNNRNATPWFRLGIWRLKILWKGAERDKCCLCEEEDIESQYT